MALTPVSKGNTGSGAAGTTIAQTSVTVATGDRIEVWVMWRSVTATCTVSDGTNTYSTAKAQIDNSVGGGSNTRVALFECANAIAGTYTITGTISTSVAARAIEVIVIPGTNTAVAGVAAGQFQHNPGTGANAITSGSITIPSANCAIVALTITQINVSAISLGTSFTTLGAITNYDSINSDTSLMEYRNVTANQGGTFTSTGGAADDFMTVAIAIPEAASGQGARTSQFLGQPMIRGPF